MRVCVGVSVYTCALSLNRLSIFSSFPLSYIPIPQQASEDGGGGCLSQTLSEHTHHAASRLQRRPFGNAGRRLQSDDRGARLASGTAVPGAANCRQAAARPDLRVGKTQNHYPSQK
jgi:hypothetical protein